MEMNPALRTHLQAMKQRRDPESSYLYPSPECGKRDEHAKSLVESFNRAMTACGLHKFASVKAQTDPRLKRRTRPGLHDIRRFFATRVLELGADPQTVSRWIGHRDGGALLLKTYASVRADHHAAIAAKIDLSVVPPASVADGSGDIGKTNGS